MIVPTSSLSTLWIVQDILSEGITLLTGADAGILSIACQLLLTVMHGGHFLAPPDEYLKIDTQYGFSAMQGNVLYLAQEITQARAQILHLMASSALSMPASISTLAFATMTQKVQDIENLLVENRTARLVILDPFEYTPDIQTTLSCAYSPGYSTLRALRSLAYKYHRAFVLLHHVRPRSRSEEESPIRPLARRSGLLDGILRFHRYGEGRDAHLHVMHRITQPIVLNLSAEDDGGWVCYERPNITLPSIETTLHGHARIVFEVMHQSPLAMSIEDIAERAKLSSRQIRQALSTMLIDGYVERIRRGIYRLHAGISDHRQNER